MHPLKSEDGSSRFLWDIITYLRNWRDHIPRPQSETHKDFDNYDSSEFTVHESGTQKSVSARLSENKLFNMLSDVSVEDHILVVVVLYSSFHFHCLKVSVYLQVALYVWE
jgi:hypothetical protein